EARGRRALVRRRQPHAHTGPRPALVRCRRPGRAGPHWRRVRTVSGQPRGATRSGRGAEVRITGERPGEWPGKGGVGPLPRPHHRPLPVSFPAVPLSEAILQALQTAWSHKLRSFFTLLGIIVSVGFLVAVVAVIQAMNAYVRHRIGGAIVGVNAFQVRRTPIAIGLIDVEDWRAIQRRPI